MANLKNLDIVEYWREMSATPVEEVFSKVSRPNKLHKSEFKNILMEVRSSVSTSVMARTTEGKRVDFSFNGYSPEFIKSFSRKISSYKNLAGKDELIYEIGYERGLNYGSPEIRYFRMIRGGKVLDERVFSE